MPSGTGVAGETPTTNLALGNNEARLSLEQFHLDGLIVIQDLQKSASHFGKAARGGLPAAIPETIL